MEFIDFPDSYCDFSQMDNLLNTILQTESMHIDMASPSPPLSPISSSASLHYYSPPPATFSPPATSNEQMRELMYCMAAMQPVKIDPEEIKPPKRKNVKVSSDPQSVAARLRREKISERIRILQRMVPGGTKMDTASMLDEAIHYVKFLKRQVQSLEQSSGSGFNSQRRYNR